MVRISDIYKKKKAESLENSELSQNHTLEIPKKETKAQGKSIFSAAMRPDKESAHTEEEETVRIADSPARQEESGIKFGRPLKMEPKSEIYSAADIKETEKVYMEFVKVIKNFYLSVAEHKARYFDNKIYEMINTVLDSFAKNDERMLSMTGKISMPEYLYSHVANVCILSMRLGLGLDYNREQCAEIGLSAIFHDLGLIRKGALINKVEKLSDSELEEIKKHSDDGRKIIFGFGFISDELKRLIANVVYQAHERVSGTGYPAGVKGEQLHNYAQIIGLVDTYEALTHHRSYRGRFLPHDVCRWLVETREAGDDFNDSLIKKFIEIIGIYPVGSFVRLSSGEIAEVIRVNSSYPLKPVVDVVITIEKERQSPPKTVNLLENPVLQIIGPIDETKIKLKDKKFALYLLTRKWITID